jgi:hypothetical protein
MKKTGPMGLMILAIFAMTLTVTASAAASAPEGTAVVAKKKCKKAHSHKKKCRKKRKRRMDAPNLPVIRATLTWSNGGADDVDMDLFVFDGNGNVAGNGSNTIPLTTLSGDVSGRAGSETFTDSLFTTQAARDLSFGVCYQVGGSVHTQFTLTYVTADGVVHGDSQNPGSAFHFDYPGGAPIPNYCAFR